MLVGAAEDVGEQPDSAFAKLEMDKAKLGGFDSIRVTQTWTKGQTKLGPTDEIVLDNAIGAAQFTGIRVVLSLYPFGSSVTPLTDQDRADFAAFAVDVATAIPLVHDFIVGNEPNLNRFWLPQFGPDGNGRRRTRVRAASGDDLRRAEGGPPALDDLRRRARAARRRQAGHGPRHALADRVHHRPRRRLPRERPPGADHGRVRVPSVPGDTRAPARTFAHPNGTSIGLADYPKLVALLGTAFDGTAQRGSALPILYDEFGIETQIPAAKATALRRHRARDHEAGRRGDAGAILPQAMQMTFCQPTVLGLMLFHVQDEPDLAAWQSGEYYVDGTPKASLGRSAAPPSASGAAIAASCPGLQLTPKLKLVAGKPTKTAEPVTLTCSLDCVYVVRLDGRKTLTGTAVGGVARKLRFTGTVARGGTRSRARNRGAQRGATRPRRANVPAVNGQYVAYTFFRVDPAWRRLPVEERAAAKDAFAEVVEELTPRFEHLRAYSTTGVRPETDFFLWKITERYEDLGELGAALKATPLAGWLETPYSYLATTKASQYTSARKARKITPKNLPYLVVYPFVKVRPWYSLTEEAASARWTSTSASGARSSRASSTTRRTRSGSTIQEFMTAFECEEPADFMHLMLRLRDIGGVRATPSATRRSSSGSTCRSARRSTASTASARASKITVRLTTAKRMP